MVNEDSASESSGIPSGALTVLIIAAVAIVSVIVSLFCMLVNNRRTRRSQERVQRFAQNGSRVTVSSNQSVTVPSFPRSLSDGPVPLYISPSVHDPKFDAPPSYDEALRSAPLTPISTACSPTNLIPPRNELSSTPASPVSLLPPVAESPTTPARIQVEMELADRPSTSNSM